MNIPNALTAARIAATPAIALLAADGGAAGSMAAAALFAAAAVTDWLDGFLARRLGQTSRLGAMFDPIADKLQVGVTLGVVLWLGALPGWHAAAALLILAREVFVSGLREAMAETGAPRIPSSFAAKAKTTVQMTALALLLAGGATGPEWLRHGGIVALWLAAGLSLTTGFDYLRAALRSLSKAD